MRFRVAHVLIVISLLAAVLVTLDYGAVGVVDGRYDLTIVVDDRSAIEADRVLHLPVHDKETADAVIENLDDFLGVMKRQDSAKPIVLGVGYSFRVSKLGRTSHGIQEYSHVVLVLHRKDGTKAVHLLEIPHREQSTRIEVTKDTLVDTTQLDGR